MADPTYDLTVIGGGPGGYVAAIRASQLGLKVALVEREQMGGICVNVGCIPTKSLIRNAELAHILTGEGKVYGFSFENLSLDYAVAQRRSRQVSERLAKGIQFLMRKNKVDVLQGAAVLRSANRIEVTAAPDAPSVNGRVFDGLLDSKRVIVATGHHPRMLPGIRADGERIITYREALALTEAPKRLVIVGAGAIGMEFAYIFRAYGSEVTVVEMLPQVLPAEDAETAAEVAKSFARQGIMLLANTRTEAVEASKSSVRVRVVDQGTGDAQTLEADQVLIAVGVAPNSADIGLETAGIGVDERGFIPIDGTMQTNVPGVYAIGDVTGKLMLAHAASAQGMIAAEHAAGRATRAFSDEDYRFMPRCTYCRPQVASLGYTEAQAKEAGLEVKVGKFPFIANGKALGLNEKEGFVKIIADARYGEILGAHLVGPDVTELLPELALARASELTIEEVARNVHAHPTLSETLMEAAHATMGQPIHI